MPAEALWLRWGQNPVESLFFSLFQEGLEGLQCSLWGVYTDGIFTRGQSMQITPALSEVEWKVEVTVHTWVPLWGIRSCYPACQSLERWCSGCLRSPQESGVMQRSNSEEHVEESGSELRRKMEMFCPFAQCSVCQRQVDSSMLPGCAVQLK